MAALFSGEDDRRFYAEDDYRAYLISRNPPPIVHHSGAGRLKRLRVHARRMVHGVDSALHWLIEALARSKTRRIQRELQLRGIRYAQRNDDAASQRKMK
ncbi:hypothetical protein BH10PSE10_BH10PSE10_28030 [soil metagenome]